MISISLDEADSTLQKEFPNRVVSATVLLPPPSAVFAEIDGDSERFVMEYAAYLDSDVVCEFNAVMLKLLHDGINVIMYIPSFNEDSVWVNQLMINQYTRYGITAGLSAEKGFAYDTRYDYHVYNILYSHDYVDVFDYIIGVNYAIKDIGSFDPNIELKVQRDLSRFVPPDMNVNEWRFWLADAGTVNRFIHPAVSFGD